MKRIALAVALALTGLVSASAPATADTTCTSTQYRTETAAGWYTLVKIRKVTVCRNDAGQAVSVRVTVRRFSLPR